MKQSLQKSAKKERGTPKDVFAHLLSTVTLAMSVIAFTTIWWQIINIRLPDVLTDYYYYTASIDLIRGSIASIVVAWPIYLFMAWMIKKDIVADPNKQNVRVRKWLMYFTLFVASITIIIDLVTLLNSFLGGELTTRFGLKMLAVLVAAGAVFGYYIWELRRDVTEKTKTPLVVGVVSSLVLVGTLVAGFVHIGSPAHQRDLRLDQQRINGLTEIQYQVINYYDAKSALPSSLEELEAFSGYALPLDPESTQSYTYQVKSDLDFELCAAFSTSSSDPAIDAYPRTTPYKEWGLASTTTWDHADGVVCFSRTIDPTILEDNVPAIR